VCKYFRRYLRVVPDQVRRLPPFRYTCTAYSCRSYYVIRGDFAIQEPFNYMLGGEDVHFHHPTLFYLPIPVIV